MQEKQRRLEGCSEGVRKAIEWLEDERIHRKERLLQKINDIKKKLKKEKNNDLEYELSNLKERYNRPEFRDSDAEEIIILSKIEPRWKEKILLASKNEKFYYFLPSPESPEIYSDLLELGIDFRPYLEFIESNTLADGRITFNNDEHVGLLKFYARYKPNSEITQKGLKYYLNNYKNIFQERFTDLKTVAEGLEALVEIDSEKYTKEINFHKNYLKKYQKLDGRFEKRKELAVEDTAYALRALMLVLPKDDPIIVKGRKYLNGLLKKNNFYKNRNTWRVTPIVRTLIDLGDGPEDSSYELEKEIRKLRTELSRIKTIFVETSPNKNVHTLRDKMMEMITTSKKEILLISPYLDTYSELVGVAKQNKNLRIKIISRPVSRFEGDKKQFAKSAYETLKSMPNVTIRLSEIVHSRLLMTDSEYLLVSSADLTHDQLYYEHNAGLTTEDKRAIQDAKNFFENIFNSSKQIKQKN